MPSSFSVHNSPAVTATTTTSSPGRGTSSSTYAVRTSSTIPPLDSVSTVDRVLFWGGVVTLASASAYALYSYYVKSTAAASSSSSSSAVAGSQPSFAAAPGRRQV